MFSSVYGYCTVGVDDDFNVRDNDKWSLFRWYGNFDLPNRRIDYKSIVILM